MDVLLGVLFVAAAMTLATWTAVAVADYRRVGRRIAYHERRIRHLTFELCQVMRDGISYDPYTAMERARREADRREGTL